MADRRADALDCATAALVGRLSDDPARRAMAVDSVVSSGDHEALCVALLALATGLARVVAADAGKTAAEFGESLRLVAQPR